MPNPWEEIRLEDYEKHMSLGSVLQLQALNRMMRSQLCIRQADTVMILGVAGGNGLEHITPGQFGRIYAVDINEEYLNATARRFPGLDRLSCVRADLADPSVRLPHADLLIADLLIEYIGIPAFCRVIGKTDPLYVSCVIQRDAPERGWVSDSPYLHVFDGLEGIHSAVPEPDLTAALGGIGYSTVFTEAEELPNGKKLIRLDHCRTA